MTKAFTDVYEIASYLSKHDDVNRLGVKPRGTRPAPPVES